MLFYTPYERDFLVVSDFSRVIVKKLYFTEVVISLNPISVF